MLRRIARLTWRYFEVFVGPQDNWLPPDNFQDDGDPRIAHRTSPTDMGLGLLSNLAAHDLGYLSSGRLLDRTTRTIESMEQLERHRGHFFNWYDTTTRQALRPRYVSTVDSGNLATSGCCERALELAGGPLVPTRALEGLSDTWRPRRADRPGEALQSVAAAGLADAFGQVAWLKESTEAVPLLSVRSTTPPRSPGGQRLRRQAIVVVDLIGWHCGCPGRSVARRGEAAADIDR